MGGKVDARANVGVLYGLWSQRVALLIRWWWTRALQRCCCHRTAVLCGNPVDNVAWDQAGERTLSHHCVCGGGVAVWGAFQWLKTPSDRNQTETFKRRRERFRAQKPTEQTQAPIWATELQLYSYWLQRNCKYTPKTMSVDKTCTRSSLFVCRRTRGSTGRWQTRMFILSLHSFTTCSRICLLVWLFQCWRPLLSRKHEHCPPLTQ